MPKLSILVPCCNVEKFIDECLLSIKNQTLEDIEIICINDGSKDTTLEILKKYASADRRIKIIDKQNTGYGDSMNIGLEQCTGEYIGIVESDDFVEPTMFEKLYNIAQKNNLDIARTGYFFYENNIDTPQKTEYIPKNKVLVPINFQKIFLQSPSIWASIYNREWLNSYKIRFLPTPGASYQDTSFSFKTYLKCRRFMMLDEYLLHYRQHPGSSINSTGKVFCVCDEWDEIIRYTKKDNHDFNKTKQLIQQLRYQTYKWNYKRLSGKSREEFLLRWSEDLKKEQIIGLPKAQKIKLRLQQFILKNVPSLYHLTTKNKN